MNGALGDAGRGRIRYLPEWLCIVHSETDAGKSRRIYGKRVFNLMDGTQSVSLEENSRNMERGDFIEASHRKYVLGEVTHGEDAAVESTFHRDARSFESGF
jgi:hypothetical protein